MIHRLVARGIALLHTAFALFVVFGSLLVWRWPSLIWVHLAAVLWAVATMTMDLGCALTAWEKSLRRRGGLEVYPEGFLEHHLTKTNLSPEKSQRLHIALGLGAVLLNLLVYALFPLGR